MIARQETKQLWIGYLLLLTANRVSIVLHQFRLKKILDNPSNFSLGDLISK